MLSKHFVVMLDLQVVPERSLGNEQWEFSLGMFLSFSMLSCQAINYSIYGKQVMQVIQPNSKQL